VNHQMRRVLSAFVWIVCCYGIFLVWKLSAEAANQFVRANRIPANCWHVSARFSNNAVLDCWLPGVDARADALSITLIWHAAAPIPDADGSVIYIVRDADRSPARQGGHPNPGGVPTWRWDDPNAFVRDDFSVKLPDTDGEYLMTAGLVHASNPLDPVPIIQSESPRSGQHDAVVLGHLSIQNGRVALLRDSVDANLRIAPAR
jgi:hypothetical protein